MRGCRLLTLAVIFVLISGLCAVGAPVKWSAPMSAYPRQWQPTAPPPTYYNPYGYSYPYAGYGHGGYPGYGGYAGYGAYYQGYGQGYGQGYPQGGYAPNQSGYSNMHNNFYGR